MGRKRPIEYKFRLSQEEAKVLQSKLAEAGIDRNNYLVKLIKDSRIYPKDQLKMLNVQYAIMNRLLRGIATNINQIAKVANANHNTSAAALLVDMHQEIRILKNNLQPLWDETRKDLWQS